MRLKRQNTSRTILLVLGIFFLCFISIMTVTFWVKDSVPDTLIQCVLGAGGVEAVAMAAIQIGKILSGEKSDHDK